MMPMAPGEKRPPVISARPSKEAENRQPVLATTAEVTGGGLLPFNIDFYYLSHHIYRQILNHEESPNIAWVSDSEVIVRTDPVASVTISLAAAADLIVNLYRWLGNDELRKLVDEQLTRVRDERRSE